MVVLPADASQQRAGTPHCAGIRQDAGKCIAFILIRLEKANLLRKMKEGFLLIVGQLRCRKLRICKPHLRIELRLRDISGLQHMLQCIE